MIGARIFPALSFAYSSFVRQGSSNSNSYHAFNEINWGNPVVDFNNANFGKVVSPRPGHNGRELQYGFKLTFWVGVGGRQKSVVGRK